MTFSSLISDTIPHHGKYSSRQGSPILRLIQHHHAATGDAGINRLTDPNQQASATYVIMSDGSIYGQVPEEFRPWTSGSFEADLPAITIEVQNISGQINGNDSDPGSWQISDAAYDSIIRLLADVASRYGWGAVSEGNYQGHRQWFQTACPGGFLWARMGDIRARANVILSGGELTEPEPAPATPPTGDKSVWQLADEVLAGLHGSGQARIDSLGDRYDEVQAEVNRRLGAGVPADAPKSVSQLADEVLAGVYGNGADRQAALGDRYAEVQAEINRRLGGGGVAPQGVNISALADAVLRGEYGTGDDRVRALGSNYDAVQAEVNRRLGGGVAAAPAARTVDISALADAVLRGEYGNGEDRQARLGDLYDEVQAEVNRRFS